MPKREPVIPPNMTLIDRAGVEWRTAPNYQDRDTSAPGFLALRSDLGTDMPFGSVVQLYGIDRDGEKVLYAVMRDA